LDDDTVEKRNLHQKRWSKVSPEVEEFINVKGRKPILRDCVQLETAAEPNTEAVSLTTGRAYLSRDIARSKWRQGGEQMRVASKSLRNTKPSVPEVFRKDGNV